MLNLIREGLIMTGGVLNLKGGGILTNGLDMSVEVMIVTLGGIISLGNGRLWKKQGERKRSDGEEAKYSYFLGRGCTWMDI